MQKIFFTTVSALMMCLSLKAQLRVGQFLGYGVGLGLWGLGVHTELLVNERLGISPVLIQYFPKKFDNTPRRSAWELDINADYYFLTGDVGNLYGLGGINYTRTRLRGHDLTGDEVQTKGDLGLNLGLGTMFRINNILPFAEAKYTLGGYSQLTFFIGARFQLGDADNLEDDY
jgi:opacity protein-like surface antigen